MGIGLGFRQPFGLPALSASDPLTIVKSTAALFFLNADLGVTIGTGVAAWADQSGNGWSADQATGGAQPALNVAALNGRNTISFDGSNDLLSFATLDFPPPATTPTWFFAVARKGNDATSFRLYGCGASRMSVFRSGVNTCQMANQNTVNAVGWTTGVWARVETLFAGSTSDYLKIGASSTTGASAGNGDPVAGGLTLGHNNGSFGLVTIACIGAWVGSPTSEEKAALDAWVTAYYGVGVEV